MKTYKLFFDGGIKGGNPGGTPSYGFAIKCNKKTVCECCGVLEDVPRTNNVAEYYALLLGLWAIAEFINTTKAEKIIIYGDSELVIKQMDGTYDVNSEHLKRIYIQCNLIIRDLIVYHNIDIEFVWIPREQNRRTDRLARNGYDNYIQ